MHGTPCPWALSTIFEMGSGCLIKSLFYKNATPKVQLRIGQGAVPDGGQMIIDEYVSIEGGQIDQEARIVIGK